MANSQPSGRLMSDGRALSQWHRGGVCRPHVTQVCPLSSPFCAGLGSQVSETEREDLEESEKIQYWVERLCQTRLEQISSADTEISEMTTGLPPSLPSVSPLAPPLRRFAGGLHLHTTDLDDIPLDMFHYPPKTASALPVMPHPPPCNPPPKVPAPPVLPSSGHVSASSSPWVQRTPPPIPIPPPPSIPTQDLTPTRPLPSALEEALGNHPFRAGETGNPAEDWEAKNHSGKPASSPVPERSFPPTPKVLPLFCMLCWEAGRVGRASVSHVLLCSCEWRREEASPHPIFQEQAPQPACRGCPACVWFLLILKCCIVR
ncbi:harmonin-like [Tursiops truncatus]|uniref:harmonin-like n=1 Tax=Tursiops truncatus TaxID=9739 RepID=UPI003CCF03DF